MALILKQMKFDGPKLIDPTSEILEKALIITNGKLVYGIPSSAIDGEQYIAVKPGEVNGEVYDSGKHSKGTFILVPKGLFISEDENRPTPLKHDLVTRKPNLSPDFIIPRAAAGVTFRGKSLSVTKDVCQEAVIVTDGKVTHGNHSFLGRYVANDPERNGEGQLVTFIENLAGTKILFPVLSFDYPK